MQKYYYPHEVTIIIDSNGKRHAYAKGTGEELIIGPPEKMSKSKKNFPKLFPDENLIYDTKNAPWDKWFKKP